jgi:transposase
VTQIICGVDVSSTALDAHVHPAGVYQRFDNSADGIAALAAFCRDHKVDLVAMEATGGYERQALYLLAAQGLCLVLANPRQVRSFAEALGLLEKTDRIDAAVIAQFAQVRRLPHWTPDAENLRRLTAQVLRLRQLTDMRTAETNRRRLVEDEDVLASFTQVLAMINREIKALEARIADLIASDPVWTKLDQTFRTIKGVADRTVARLMADLPEIGTLSNKAISKLVGLAPIARDSGKKTGKRPVRGGRSSVRDILFMVAAVVVKFDPDLKAFHERLIKAGKPKKLARAAVAHKLLVRLNAKARDTRKLLTVAT